MTNLEKYNKDMEDVIWYVETNELPKELITMFKSSHKSLLKKIAEEEIERLNKTKAKGQIEDMLIGYSNAIDDEYLHWKEIISKLD